MNSDTGCSSDFEVIGVVDDKLFITDLDLGGRSVTNAAENVAAWAQQNYPGKRLIYRDSIGRWDEIIITSSNIVTFIPYAEEFPLNRLVRAYEEV